MIDLELLWAQNASIENFNPEKKPKHDEEMNGENSPSI